MSTSEIRTVVREKYGQAALRVRSGAGNACCGGAAALDGSCDPITSDLYNEGQAGEIPESAQIGRAHV